MMMKRIILGHGAGGELMQKLVKQIISRIDLKKTLEGSGLDKLEDSAIVNLGDKKIAFTTDSYTVNPIFFPGGDIGKLAVFGTINDLAVMGAKPLALTLSYIIEEGFPLKNLEKITCSVNEASKKVKVPIISGDTKVVEKGKLDKIIINTSGLGIVNEVITNYGAKPGDKIIVSGSVGDHGLALLAKRFGFETELKSDCAPVWKIVDAMLKVGGVHAMKDPTRGGLAACLNELAQKSKVCFFVNEEKIPVKREAKSIGEILGIDPLQTACEGRIVACVDPSCSEKILKVMGKKASIIGEVKEQPKGKVILETVVGGRRFLESPIGELYPRIC
jgi:hydrogenase expression/formation protein HypE